MPTFVYPAEVGSSRSVAELFAEVPQFWKQLREVNTSERQYHPLIIRRETSIQPAGHVWHGIPSQCCPAAEQEVMGISRNVRYSGCPEKLWNLCPWKESQCARMQSWATDSC